MKPKVNIELLLACIEDEILLGNHDCLDGFGIFSITAQSKRPINNPDEIRTESIDVKRVVFNPSKPLSKRIKIAKFVLAPKKQINEFRERLHLPHLQSGK